MLAKTAPQRYTENAPSISSGQLLYSWFNCEGCHGYAGGGGIGPSFRDAEWIYGGRPELVFASILDGRPNGMPAFGSRLSHREIWDLAAYVLTFSRARFDVAPSRPDGISVAPQMTPGNMPKTAR